MRSVPFEKPFCSVRLESWPLPLILIELRHGLLLLPLRPLRLSHGGFLASGAVLQDCAREATWSLENACALLSFVYGDRSLDNGSRMIFDQLGGATGESQVPQALDYALLLSTNRVFEEGWLDAQVGRRRYVYLRAWTIKGWTSGWSDWRSWGRTWF
jgi:hypothetical protein